MKRKDILTTIIADFHSQALPKIWKRDLVIPLDTGKIITLAGVRRSGKTFHLFQVMNNLLKLGIPKKNLVYINFEDERLNLSIADMEDIIQAYRELYPDIDLSTVYFFFDEIQEITGWEKFVIRVYNTISKYIFVTGSNAKMLSQEIATSLRGRTITYQVFPLSFREYLRIKSPQIKLTTSKDRAKVLSLFRQFIKHGGFPELINQKKNVRQKILQEYFNTMVLRDIIERYNISSVTILKYFCKRVVALSGGELSINKIYNELKSQGYKISKDTLYQYQDYIENIYLVRMIPKHSHSIVKSELSHKKVYIIDSGLGASLDYKLSHDKGRLLETSIALELEKMGHDIAYQSNGFECDFIIRENGNVSDLIQVSMSLENIKTRKREIRGLVESAKKHNLKKGIILTMDEQESFVEKGVKIEVLPAWKYLVK